MIVPPANSSAVNLMHELPLYDQAGHLRVVVEVPRGSGVKLKYNDRLGVFEWSRILSLGVSYPYDFGFLPQTLAGDGDAVDALVFADVGGFPGVVVPSRILGALRVEQKRLDQPKKRNDRVLVAPAVDHRGQRLDNIDGVPRRVLDEIEAFFAASLALTGKVVEFCGWADADEAAELVTAAHDRYRSEVAR